MVDSIRKNLDLYVVIALGAGTALLAYHFWLKGTGKSASGIAGYPRLGG